MILSKYEENKLKKCLLFQEMSMEQMKEIINSIGLYKKSYGKGQMIFQEGDVVENIGIILQGECGIIKLYPDGKEHFLQKLNEGYLTSIEIVCTSSKISPYSIVCLEETTMYFFSYEKIEQAGFMNEEIRLKLQKIILQWIASENIKKYYKINILSANSLRERILLYLQLQRRKAGKDTFTIPFDRAQFANYLCVNRSALSKELGKMQREGVIICKKNIFTIL